MIYLSTERSSGRIAGRGMPRPAITHLTDISKTQAADAVPAEELKSESLFPVGGNTVLERPFAGWKAVPAVIGCDPP
ncbi:hypothetical protein [Niveispirillum fermenti]|uniref:hypothetical protein n=1 Tax=Niveispirillum fermenti TaxID=1233113 RepID=UPI004042BF2C